MTTTPTTPSTDQQALVSSQAGMRLIAQTTLYNARKWDRLAAFIAENYAPAALQEQSAEARLTEFRDLYARLGRLHVLQVLATDPHHVVVVMEEEHEAETGASLHDLTCEAEYPHRVLAYDRAPIAVEWTDE